ncbi:putative toxin-antitoxin system toxin component, PIN family [Microcystis flos-aquae]|uniref:putative toxin-antitoxin system toxin component, PIN family n=1 Tax=Microcystis flos-aquae TaxID=109615 RepID=UPI001F552ED9|nr:putative toxin-antitoxin system toxin component, PIN family [Microcystis flos-aquae]
MDNKPPIKVIIDTNLWISFLIGKQLAGLKYLLIEKTLVPIFSPQLLNEINLVTKRPKLQKHFPKSKVQELLELLSIIGLCIETKSKINIWTSPLTKSLQGVTRRLKGLLDKAHSR